MNQPTKADLALAATVAARVEAGLSRWDPAGVEVPTLPAQRKAMRGRPQHAPSVNGIALQLARVRTAEQQAERAAEAETRRVDAAARALVAETAQKAELATAMDSLLARGREVQEKRLSLPCAPHPDNDREAIRACQSVQAFRGCQWDGIPEMCARGRVDEAYINARKRLDAAGVPDEFKARILASLPGHRIAGKRAAPVDLDPRDAVLTVRGWLTGKPCTLPFLREPLTGEETILVLAGAMRCRKTSAACLAIAQEGGRFVTSGDLAGIAIEVDELTAEPMLLIDDLGLEPLTEWTRDKLVRLLIARLAFRRRTVITTNLQRRPDEAGKVAPRDTFVGRYDERIDRRISESGRWIVLAKDWQ